MFKAVTLISLCSLSALLAAGCSQQPPPAPANAAPPYNTSLTMKQLMEFVIDPAVDEVWDSVAIIITEKGENQKAPKTDEEWAKVRNGAATVQEAGNLLMMQGRARDDKQWMAMAKRMSDAANIALKAAEKKDVAALFDSGATIYNACSACHAAYRVGDGAPVAPAVKVMPESAPAVAPAKSAK
jgi:hypothetical protein